MERIQMYCDGGCRGNGIVKENIGAWGVYLSFAGREKELGGTARGTTNNKMELKATIEALKALKKRTTPVTVYLDSAYVLNGITNWIHGWIAKGWVNSKKQPVENQELWKELYALKREFADIEFIKVKGHSDNEGNIRADKICNVLMNKIEDTEYLESWGVTDYVL